jgi:hypothetical protein
MPPKDNKPFIFGGVLWSVTFQISLLFSAKPLPVRVAVFSGSVKCDPNTLQRAEICWWNQLGSSGDK